MMNIYKRVKELREERGLTQDELAELVGYKNRSSIARIERGDSYIPQPMIKKIADALGVFPGDLMGWDNKEVEEFSLDEKSIIYRFRMLNRAGRKRVRAILNDYTEIEKYQKGHEVNPEEDPD